MHPVVMNLKKYLAEFERGPERMTERRRLATSLVVSLETIRSWEKGRRKPCLEILPRVVEATLGKCQAHELNPSYAPLMALAAAQARVRTVPNCGKRETMQKPDTAVTGAECG